MNRRPIAFLSMDSLEGFCTYDHLPAAVLESRGWTVEYPSWRSATDWTRFSAVVIRSPWDYQSAPDDYFAVLRGIVASGAPLHNSLAIVGWNLRKTYLLELADRGVPTIPTHWGTSLCEGDLMRLTAQFEVDEIVLKPIVGANADGAFRLRVPFTGDAAAAALRHYASSPFMAQPFLNSIVQDGELSLFYFLGVYSHAIHKKPKPGDFRVQEEHGGLISPTTPSAAVRAAADSVMAALPGETLYARVDLAQLNDGIWAVMEVELNEPSLYFNMDPESPRRFADAVERVVAG